MKRQISPFIVIIFIVGVLISAYLVITQTNLIYKQQVFTKKIVLETEDSDAGYINLKRNIATPSALDWATFEENGQNYVFFSVLKGGFVEKQVQFNLPENLEKGRYYVDFEVRYISGKVEVGVLSFRVK